MYLHKGRSLLFSDKIENAVVQKVEDTQWGGQTYYIRLSYRKLDADSEYTLYLGSKITFRPYFCLKTQENSILTHFLHDI